jgi:hypothetical protein
MDREITTLNNFIKDMDVEIERLKDELKKRADK